MATKKSFALLSVSVAPLPFRMTAVVSLGAAVAETSEQLPVPYPTLSTRMEFSDAQVFVVPL